MIVTKSKIIMILAERQFRIVHFCHNLPKLVLFSFFHRIGHDFPAEPSHNSRTCHCFPGIRPAVCVVLVIEGVRLAGGFYGPVQVFGLVHVLHPPHAHTVGTADKHRLYGHLADRDYGLVIP